MQSRARRKALFYVSLLMFFANNVYQVRSTFLNSEDRNAVGLIEDQKSTLNSSTQKTRSSRSQVLSDCGTFPLSPIQPAYVANAQVKKCCPSGEIYEQQTENDSYRCVPGKITVDIEIIFAVFYGDLECVKAKDYKPHFGYVPNDSCFHNSIKFMYSREQNDEMYVLQNGSLLVVSVDTPLTVFDLYCVEMDFSGKLLAKVCDELEPIILKATVPLISTGLMISSIALVSTCLAYAFVPKLNDIFGYLLVGHAGTFLAGMILMVKVICSDQTGGVVESLGHAFMMSSYLLFLFMNIHNYEYADYFLYKGVEMNFENRRGFYILTAILFTITNVVLCLSSRNSRIFFSFLYIYHAAIAAVLFLTQRALIEISLFIKLPILNSRINSKRLRHIKSLNQLCRFEAIFSLFCWVRYSFLQQHRVGRDDFYRILSVYMVILQGIFIGFIFLGQRNEWAIVRDYFCVGLGGSVHADAIEMGVLTNQSSSLLTHTDDDRFYRGRRSDRTIETALES